MRIIFSMLLAASCFPIFLNAQQLRYGLKTGLNFSRINGPSETANGTDLESWKNTTGFHIGIAFDYEVTDRFGLRGEAVYSKRGGNYTFNGPSYRLFATSAGTVRSTGRSNYKINVNNSYIDIPLTAYGKFGKIEVSGGGYVGFLVQSVGEGTLSYTNGITAAPANIRLDSLDFNLHHNYRRDEPGEGSGDVQRVRVENALLELPSTLGAYYDQKEDNGSLYNAVDYGLVGGASFYLTSSLNLQGRFQYGLADLTRNKADVSRSTLNADGTPIFRDDRDQNWNITVSVGFKF
jgi:hypothetical protein